MEDTSLLSDIAQVLVPERQPTSLYELSIPICTTSYQKDGNLKDTIPPDLLKSEDKSATTAG
jgi:hypothetical protein